MDSIFTIIVIILLALAVSGLVVGVANDAVNFLNSALGSKAAPRYVILTVASVGIIIGALTSSGMMEVARSGVFYPSMFTFSEVMLLFLGVMFANVLLLDLFNTFGLPTSTTVSLVFGLLGAAMAVSTVKIAGSDILTIADMSQFINSGKAMAIIFAIVISVVIAFVCGSVIMYLTRIIFSFRYHSTFSKFGALWCGIAFAAISYFAVFKGLKGTSLISPALIDFAHHSPWMFILSLWGGWSILMYLLQHLFKINILRITVLAGTFSLALAFAGNDLVNFIGVPIAGYDSYKIALATGDMNMMMGDLSKPVVANFGFLILAGVIMVLTLWFSKKAKTVTETEINLARQDEGGERFGSTLVSRALVGAAMSFNKNYQRVVPARMQVAIERRFRPVAIDNQASFDLIRATVNLTVASLLISMATSLKLPLSTTYVTFMVAMGSSLADRAWGRESAVYRITGVLTVIAGWFFTALIAFIIAYGVTLLLMYGGTIAVIAITALCIFLMIQSSVLHKKRAAKTETKEDRIGADQQDILARCAEEVGETMEKVTRIYSETLMGVSSENRKQLKKAVRESEELYQQASERKYEMLPTLQKLQDNDIDTGHYYVQVVDYLNEVTKALVHITRPCFTHIDNHHEGLTKAQVGDLTQINEKVSVIYHKINYMLRNNDFRDIELILHLRDALFDTLAVAIKNQIKRIKTKSSSTKASMLYLTILNETKTMILQSRNLLKSQKYFIENH
ncbi:MAG: inorganic phosphate transporter [Rikenellaceae bacterium]|nr:inorganic phosphate transporter [Rikenellaceae bacterium]